jgi:hypothetical protein
MKKLEAGCHVVVQRGFLFKRTLSTFRHDGHRELLTTHMPQGAFNVNNRGRAEKTLFASIGLLGDRRVKTYDGCHGHDACGVLRDMITNYTAYLAMWIVSLGIFKLAFASGWLKERDVRKKRKGFEGGSGD